MSDNILTLERARAAAEKIAEERGDTVYAPDGKGTCAYVPFPQIFTSDTIIKNYMEKNIDLTVRMVSGCLVGELLKAEGLLTLNVQQNAQELILDLIEKEDLIVDDGKVANYLSDLQLSQDRGDSWSEAYEYAESRLCEND